MSSSDSEIQTVFLTYSSEGSFVGKMEEAIDEDDVIVIDIHFRGKYFVFVEFDTDKIIVHCRQKCRN